VQVDLNLARSDERNQRCYLERFGGCSARITREHYISAGLLEIIAREGENGLVGVSGPRWTPDGKLRALPLTAFTAKILCKYHNEALSPLDAEAKRLYAGLFEMTRPDSQPGVKVLLNGFDIERWVFKVLCGELIGGIVLGSHSERLGGDCFPDEQLALVADAELWKAADLGLYYASQAVHLHPPDLRFAPIVNQEKRSIEGAHFSVWGLEFFLVALPGLAEKIRATRQLLHRPSRFSFANEDGDSELLISWNDARSGGEVRFTERPTIT